MSRTIKKATAILLVLVVLNVLHFGSSAVSGFDPKDTADWPAIDAGYYHAAAMN